MPQTSDPHLLVLHFPVVSYIYNNSGGVVATSAVVIRGDRADFPIQMVSLDVGTAYCSPEENFSRASGRRRARKRLLKGYFGYGSRFYATMDTTVPREESMHKVAYRAIPALLRGAPHRFDFDNLSKGPRR